MTDWGEIRRLAASPERMQRKEACPERVVADVRRVVPEDGIVLVDVGAHHNWMVAEYEVWKPRTLLQTWGYASNRPTVLDVRVDPDVRPLATGSWDLPPLPPPNPNFGWEED